MSKKRTKNCGSDCRTRMQLLSLSPSRTSWRAWSLSAAFMETWKKTTGNKTPNHKKIPPKVHEIKTIKQVSSRSAGQVHSFFLSLFFLHLNQIFHGVKCVNAKIKVELFFTATNNVETRGINSSALTLTASEFC